MYPGIVLVRRAGAVFTLAAMLGGVANAGLMNFETASQGSFFTAPFDEDGIRLSLIAGHYDVWSCISFICPPDNGIVAGLDAVHTGPSTVRIALISGSLFNLDGIQIVAADSSSFMVASNGSFVSFGVPGGTLAGFQGIQFFDISSRADIAGGFLFDNVAVTAVPESSTFMLLFLTFVTLSVGVYARVGKNRHSHSSSFPRGSIV